MSLFHKSAPPPPVPEPEGPLAEFITLTIPGDHFTWTLKPKPQLDAFVEALQDHMIAIDLGELRFIESIDDAALLYLDAPNAEAFADVLLPWLRQQSFCTGTRVVVDADINEDGRTRRELTL